MIRWKDSTVRITIVRTLAVMAVWACYLSADCVQAHAASNGITVQTHTQEEIRDYVSRLGASLQDGLYFAVDPVTEAPYNAGQLSDDTKKSALNMLKQIRYIAGLSDQIEESGAYSYYAQASSLVNYANGSLSHHPAQPAGMDTELFHAGYEGASKSNLSMHSRSGRSMNETIVMSFLNDSDRSNISSVGHRRWLLNPKMKQAGFGAVSGPKGTYCSIYVLDKGNSQASESGVAWPAQNMPVEYFTTGFAWSISLGDLLDAEKIHVTLTRTSDQKTWNFSRASSDGDFYVDNEDYNYCYEKNGCIIFRPPAEEIGSYRAGDVYEVDITGTASPVSYKVRFFQLHAGGSDTGSNSDTGNNADTGSNSDTGSNAGQGKEDTVQKEYTVTFLASGGTLQGSQSQRTVMRRLERFPTAYKEGHTFQGWFSAPTGGKQVTAEHIFDADITLYAQWTEVVREYMVTFLANGGICEVSALQTTNQKVAKLPTPVRKGYRFQGWFTQPEGGRRVTDSQIFSENMALYAQWMPDNIQDTITDVDTETEYTVVFHANGGTCSTTSLQTSGCRLTSLPVPYRSGYLFDGWYTTPDAGDRITEATIYKKNHILFAHWTKTGSSFESADSGSGTDFDTETEEQIVSVSVPKVKGVSLKHTKKGKVTVRWTWYSRGSGYQIACSTSRSFPKGKTKVKGAGAYDDAKTITGLKKGKTYYVRVRAYQKLDGRKYYGSWSKVKKVKIRK